MSKLSDEKAYLEYLKDKLINGMSKKATNSGFRQVLRLLDALNQDLDRINKALKGK